MHIQNPIVCFFLLLSTAYSSNTPFLDLPVEDAEVQGAQIEKEGTYMQKIRQWSSPETRLSWSIEVKHSGRVAVFVHQAYADDAEPGKYKLSLGDQSIEAKVLTTPNWYSYQKVHIGDLNFKKPGTYQLELRPVKVSGPTLMHFDKISLEGSPAKGASRTGYSLVNKIPRGISAPVQDIGIEHNTLSEFEKEAGWSLLFDGKSLNGWQSFRTPDISKRWSVRDNCLTYTANEEIKGGHLITSAKYSDFEFVCEWSVASGGDSGIFLRFDETKFNPFEQFVEYQIFDNHSVAGLNPKHASGAGYDLYPTDLGAYKGSDKWNHSRIILKNNRVEFFLNHVKTADFRIDSEDTKQKIAESKFHRWADFGKVKAGHIGLQDYFSSIRFRNLKIRDLSVIPQK